MRPLVYGKYIAYIVLENSKFKVGPDLPARYTAGMRKNSKFKRGRDTWVREPNTGKPEAIFLFKPSLHFASKFKGQRRDKISIECAIYLQK